MEQTHIIQKKIYAQVSSLHYFNILPDILIMDYYAFSQQIWNQTNLSKLNNNASFQRLAKKLKIQTQKYTLGTNWRSDIGTTQQVGKRQSERQTDWLIDLLTDRLPYKSKKPTDQLTNRPPDWQESDWLTDWHRSPDRRKMFWFMANSHTYQMKDWLIYGMTNWLTLWMTKELTDRVGGRLTDKWLTV